MRYEAAQQHHEALVECGPGDAGAARLKRHVVKPPALEQREWRLVGREAQLLSGRELGGGSVHEDVELQWLRDVCTPGLKLVVQREDLIGLDIELSGQRSRDCGRQGNQRGSA